MAKTLFTLLSIAGCSIGSAAWVLAIIYGAALHAAPAV
jgi:hypothetical protein